MTKTPDRSPEFLAFMASRQGVSPTGRLKTTEPNMQNLKPPMSAESKATVKAIRDAIVNPAIPIAVPFRPERVKDLVRFIKAREDARIAKERGFQYDGDEIIERYRFCNMHREDDRVTRWIADNWRTPNTSDPDLWFAMCVARMALNSIDTMDAVGYPVPWNPTRFKKVIAKRKQMGLKIFGAAYMIATPNWTGPKDEFLVERLLGPLWARRKELRPTKDDTLQSFHARLNAVLNVGSFTAAQVVADMKYVAPLSKATDWAEWAAPGPGSRRGLNRVCLRNIDTPWKDADWLATLQRLRKAVKSLMPKFELHAQDLQNCLCEFDKYERSRLGEGKPKQLYVPHKS